MAWERSAGPAEGRPIRHVELAPTDAGAEMDDEAKDSEIVLEVEAAAPGRRGRARWIGALTAVAVLGAGVGAVALLGGGSDAQDQARAVQTEESSSASAAPTTTSTVVVAAPTTTEAPVSITTVPAPPPTVVLPALDDLQVSIPSGGPPAGPIVPPPAPSRFRVVPGDPLPLGTPVSAFVSGEVRLGPGGKTYGRMLEMQPGDSLESISPDFVALMRQDAAVLCGYLPRVVGMGPPEGLPLYDVDGATVVARLTSQGCVPLDQLDEPPAPTAP